MNAQQLADCCAPLPSRSREIRVKTLAVEGVNFAEGVN